MKSKAVPGYRTPKKLVAVKVLVARYGNLQDLGTTKLVNRVIVEEILFEENIELHDL